MPELSAESEWDGLAEVRARAVDLGIALAWFVVLAVAGGLLWWQLTPLAEYTRTATNAMMDEEQLGVQVNADGWFFVIAAVGGLVSGVVLLSWRKRDPLFMVVVVAVGGLLATWLMLQTGLIAGPPDPDTVLPTAKAGAKIPLQLTIRAEGLWVVWSVSALLGAVGVIWGTDHVPGHVSDPESAELT
ncbi:MAG: hypothetical protein J7518_02365 [Nocardioidaceae bacterium]|nr:hypothetical protein [Nocardioidaceae bacterium]